MLSLFLGEKPENSKEEHDTSQQNSVNTTRKRNNIVGQNGDSHENDIV